MPLYEFRCAACDATFELLVRKGDEPACPQCRSTQVNRLLSTFGVSSAATRQSHLQAARKKNAKVARDKQIAEAEAAEHDHH